MAKVTYDDLERANASSSLDLLAETAVDSSKIASVIENFINNSKTYLTGGGYDAVRLKLGLYVDALRKQYQICVNLPNNVKAANFSLITYMEGYTPLDDSKISECERLLASARATLDYLRQPNYVKNDKGVYVESGTIGSADEISSWDNSVRTLEKILEKLKGLQDADSSAYSNISSVEGDVSSFLSAINGISNNSFSKIKGIKPVDEVEFIPDKDASPNGLDSAIINSGHVYTGSLSNGNSLRGYGQMDAYWNCHSDAYCALFSATTLVDTVTQGKYNLNPDKVYNWLETYNPNYYNGRKTQLNISADATNYMEKIVVGAGLDCTHDLDFNHNRNSDGSFSDKDAIDSVIEKGGALLINGNSENWNELYKWGHVVAVVDYDPNTEKYKVWEPYSNSCMEVDYSTLKKNGSSAHFLTVAPPGETVEDIINEGNYGEDLLHVRNGQGVHYKEVYGGKCDGELLTYNEEE